MISTSKDKVGFIRQYGGEGITAEETTLLKTQTRYFMSVMSRGVCLQCVCDRKCRLTYS